MKKTHRGFTLMEVIIALAIASLGATVMYEVISASAVRTPSLHDRRQAVLLAQSKLSELGWTVDPEETELRGKFVDGRYWQITLDYDEDSGIPELVEVEIIVEAGAARHIRLSTLRWVEQDE